MMSLIIMAVVICCVLVQSVQFKASYRICKHTAGMTEYYFNTKHDITHE